MTAMESDSSLASKCLDLCQMLASQGQSFTFSVTIGSTFNFSVEHSQPGIPGFKCQSRGEEEEPLNSKKRCKEEERIPEKEIPSVNTRPHWCDPGWPGCSTCDCTQGECIQVWPMWKQLQVRKWIEDSHRKSPQECEHAEGGSPKLTQWFRGHLLPPVLDASREEEECNWIAIGLCKNCPAELSGQYCCERSKQLCVRVEAGSECTTLTQLLNGFISVICMLADPHSMSSSSNPSVAWLSFLV